MKDLQSEKVFVFFREVKMKIWHCTGVGGISEPQSTPLKVRQSWKQIMVSSILPKKER